MSQKNDFDKSEQVGDNEEPMLSKLEPPHRLKSKSKTTINQSFSEFTSGAENNFKYVLDQIQRLSKAQFVYLALPDWHCSSWEDDQNHLKIYEPHIITEFLEIGKGSLIINDARHDDRLASHPLVVGPPYISFYARFPINKSGSLVLIGDQGQALVDDQQEEMMLLIGRIEFLIELKNQRGLVSQLLLPGELGNDLSKKVGDHKNSGLSVKVPGVAHYLPSEDFPANFDKQQESLKAKLISQGSSLSLILIRLYNLKELDYQIGDQRLFDILQELALSLSKLLGPSGSLYQINETDLVVLLDGFTYDRELELIARLRALVGYPAQAGDQSVNIISQFTFVANRLGFKNQDLLESALEIAEAQHPLKKDSLVMANPSLLGAASRQVIIKKALEDQIASKYFKVAYMPIVNLADQKIIAHEALARLWILELGWIDPEEFITIAEKSNLVGELDMIVLGESLNDLAQNKISGDYISVNLSPQGINENTFDKIQEIIDRLELLPSQLTIEITERADLADQKLRIFCAKAVAAGISVAIDDFGSGETALSHMFSLPIDTIKLDKSFLRQKAFVNQKVIRMLVTMTTSLDLKLIVEGIEKNDQRELLTSAGVQYGQGFLFSEPFLRAGDK